MPTVVEGFEAARVVRPKSGERLAIPTKFNIRRVRSSGKRAPIFSTERMMQLTKQRPAMARMAPSRRNGSVLIWYLKVNKISSRSIYKGKSWVLRKYRVGKDTLSNKGIQRDWVPMFVLIRPYTARKRLDIASVRGRAAGIYARNAVSELGRLN
jgi:hypothetical protein